MEVGSFLGKCCSRVVFILILIFVRIYFCLVVVKENNYCDVLFLWVYSSLVLDSFYVYGATNLILGMFRTRKNQGLSKNPFRRVVAALIPNPLREISFRPKRRDHFSDCN